MEKLRIFKNLSQYSRSTSWVTGRRWQSRPRRWRGWVSGTQRERERGRSTLVWQPKQRMKCSGLWSRSRCGRCRSEKWPPLRWTTSSDRSAWLGWRMKNERKIGEEMWDIVLKNHVVWVAEKRAYRGNSPAFYFLIILVHCNSSSSSKLKITERPNFSFCANPL